LSEVDPNVRESVVRIIGHLDSTECEVAVVACCDDPNELVRIAALEQLPNFAHAPSVELLTGALTDDVPRVRATAVQTLGKFESDESVRALRSALGDADPWTRYFAIRSLSGVKDVHSLDRFRDIASGDEAEQVRVAAEEAIRRVQP
jgi:HEAT repeat protein